jgi:alpha-glucuronidase
MQADGYTSVDATPWETASGGKAVACDRTSACTLTAKLDKPAGNYTIAVQYFDLRTGASKYDLLLNGASIAHWTADAILPAATIDKRLDGSTSTRYTISNIALKPGDTLTLSGTPDGDEHAPVDYIEITPTKDRTHP